MNEALKPDVTERATPAELAPARSRRRGQWGWIVIIAALAAAAAFAYLSYERSTPSTDDAQHAGRTGQGPQTVRVGSVVTGDMPLTIDALGTVTPFETVTIKTQIAGVLQKVGFTEGQIVKQGDFIAQIDPRPYEAALAQAQGQLAKDQALLAQAESDLSRYEQLNRQDSISKQQVTDQEALVAQDKAAITTDQAMVQTAKLNVDYTHIVSPVTGRVGLRLVDPGNYLQPSDTTGIVVITQIDPISVVFSTPEDNIPRIAARLNADAKLKVTVFDRANANQLAVGTLTTFDSQVDVTTGTIKMRATFDNPNGVLFPEQFVNVTILVDTMTGVTLAPNPSIQLGATGNFVYLLNEDSAVSKRDIVIGPTDGKHTVVSSGLAPGDKVVIDGVDRLRDGAKVKVVGSPPAVASQGAAGPSDDAASGGGDAAAGAGHRHHRHRNGDETPVGGDSASTNAPQTEPNAGAGTPGSPAPLSGGSASSPSAPAASAGQPAQGAAAPSSAQGGTK
jgi:multidrug efflux system membrane fusion protein